MTAPASHRRRLVWLLRVVGTLAGVAYVAYMVQGQNLGDAAGRVPLLMLAAAIAAVALNVAVGAVRWRVLLDAYGASQVPPWRRLIYLYFQSFFYNNCLPGAVTGDVVRGIATRQAFGPHGLTGTMAVVLVERILGLFGLFVLLAVGLVVAGGVADDPGSLWLWTGIGVAGTLAVVAAVASARRLAPRLPGRLGEIAGRLPAIVRPGAFAAAVALSVVTQVFVALAGWLLLVSLDPGVGFAASLLVVPLASATTFLPITVGGTGAREAVFILLCGRLFGMPESDAVVASLGLWLAHLVVGAAGGLAQVFERGDTAAQPVADLDSA